VINLVRTYAEFQNQHIVVFNLSTRMHDFNTIVPKRPFSKARLLFQGFKYPISTFVECTYCRKCSCSSELTLMIMAVFCDSLYRDWDHVRLQVWILGTYLPVCIAGVCVVIHLLRIMRLQCNFSPGLKHIQVQSLTCFLIL